MLNVRPLPMFGVEILDLPSKFPLDADYRSDFRELFDQHGLLLLRDIDLTDEQQVALSEVVGRVSPQGSNMKSGSKTMYVSNARPDGVIPDGEMFFHFDHSYFEYPLKALSLYALRVVKKGGQTLFSDAMAAYRALPSDLKVRIDGLKVRHVFDYADQRSDRRLRIANLTPQANWADHPVAWTHPRTGEKMLMVSRMTSDSIVGLPEEESEALLSALFDYVESEGVVYSHSWHLKDYVIWDNLRFQHARTPFDSNEKRELRRVPIANDKLAMAVPPAA